jgi:hypothetical protein
MPYAAKDTTIWLRSDRGDSVQARIIETLAAHYVTRIELLFDTET